VAIGVHNYWDSYKVYKMSQYSHRATDRVYVHELLLASTVLVEGKVLRTVYYSNPFGVLRLTWEVRYAVL
jgi:hypothetical protein